MQPPEVAAAENPEQTLDAVRERTKAAIKADSAFEHTEDDTLRYVALSTGVRSMLLNSQKSAYAIEKELNTDDRRKEGDTKKLSAAERQKYEDFLSEVQSWTYLLPHLLKTVRGVQYSPEVQESMDTMMTNIAESLKAGESLEKSRLGIVMRSQVENVNMTIEEMASIATYEWLRRTAPPPLPKVKRDPALLKEHLKSIGILKQQEEKYSTEVLETEESQKGVRKTADEERALQGTARVTQGYPGAEMLLDRPEVSLNIWKRLLIEGGPREKKNGAKQLRVSVENFQQQFVQKEALKKFEGQVNSIVRELVTSNKVEQEKSKRILGFLLGEFGEAGVDRLTTHPEEFEAVQEAIMTKVREAFDQISTSENQKATNDLLDFLYTMEKGEKVDNARLTQSIEAYMEIQTNNRDLMSAVQRWQVAENALRVGGRGEQTRAGQMIDQATRIDDGQSGIEWVKRLAPYGSFQTRGYVSPDGRFVLLPPSKNRVSEQGFGHIKEIGKAVGGAAVSYGLAYTILSATKWGRVARPLAPIAAAEFQMAATKGAVHQEVIARGMARTEVVLEDLRHLERGTDRDGKLIDPRLKKQLAREAGNILFAEMLSILQAAKASNSPFASEHEQATPDVENILEAHLYANQLLNSFGFPGYHQVPDGMTLPDAKDTSLSPDIREYLMQRKGPDQSDVIKNIRGRLTELRKYEDRLMHERSPGDTSKEKSRAQRMLESTEPPLSRTLPEMKDLLESKEFERGYTQFKNTTTRAQVLKKVGGWVGLKSTIDKGVLPFTSPNPLQRVWRQLGKEVFGSKPPTVHELVGDKKKEWQPDLKNVQKTTIAELLNHVQYLQENPPTNAEIAQWYKDAGISGIGDKQIDAFYGPEGKRTRLTDSLLTSWLQLRMQADTFVDSAKETEK